MKSYQTITLQDGRVLQYRVFGDPEGYPLINCHGGLVSGLDVMFAHEAAKAANIQLISPNRPGIGVSTRDRDRTLLGWSQDVVELADHLGLQKFGLMGWSMGGPYALACAYALGTRVTHTILIASSLDLSIGNRLAQLSKVDQRFVHNALHNPWQLHLKCNLMKLTAKVMPKTFQKQLAHELGGEDARVITKEPAAYCAQPAAEALQHTSGILDEYRVFAEPWKFDLRMIKTPMSIWQGTADTLVRKAWASELQHDLPHSTLHLVKQGGHFIAHSHMTEVLSELSEDSEL